MNLAITVDAVGDQLPLALVYVAVGALLTKLVELAFRHTGPTKKADEREFADVLRRTRAHSARWLAARRGSRDDTRPILAKGVRADMNQAMWPINPAQSATTARGVAQAPSTIDRIRPAAMTGKMDLREFLCAVEDECLATISGRRRTDADRRGAHAAATGHIARPGGAGWETSNEITKPLNGHRR